MGTTSWRYFTPYEEDAEAALQSLRAEVFARGEYSDPTAPLESALERFGQDRKSPDVRDAITNATQIQRALETGDVRDLSRANRALVKKLQEAHRWAAQLKALTPATTSGPPRTIEELLDRAAECGTHSILDIERTGKRLGFGIAAPLSPAMLRQVFKTVEPTRDQIEQHWVTIPEQLAPWQARFAAVCAGGRPQEYVFIGCSGD